MDAFKYYTNLDDSGREACRTKEGRRNFWMLGVDEDALWQGGWGRVSRPDSLTSFRFPTDDSLRSANLRKMVRRGVAYQRVHGEPFGSRITVSTESSEFIPILDEIEQWMYTPVEAYTHRRFPVLSEYEVTKRFDNQDPYCWSTFTLNDNPAQVAFGRDIVRLLPEYDRFLIDVPGGQEVYVRFLELRPYGDGESDEVMTETASKFCQMFNIFLINGVYNNSTLKNAREEVENRVRREFVSYADSVLEDQEAVSQFCGQFYGCDAATKLGRMMDEEFFWGSDNADYPELEVNDPDGGRISVETITCDEGLAAAYAAWLHRHWLDHLDGKVTLVAYDQPELLEVE